MPSRPAILVVDDDPAVRGLLVRALEADYDVLTAAGGDEAAAVCRADPGRIAAVVTDAHMPQGSGFALGRWLRGHRPGLPVLLVSGGASREELAAEGLAGLPWLPKPFTPAQVRQAVAALLRGGGGPAEPGAAADGGGMTAFPGS